MFPGRLSPKLATALLAIAQGWFALAAPERAQAGVVLKEVRHWSAPDFTKVALETTGEVEYRYDRLQNPDRIFVDLFDVDTGRKFKGVAYSVPVEDGIVKRIRVALNQAGVTRVVMDLAVPAVVTATQLTNPDRVVLEFRRVGPSVEPLQPVGPETPAVEPKPQPPISQAPAPQPARAESARVEPARAEPPPKRPAAKAFVPPPPPPPKPPQQLNIDTTRLPLVAINSKLPAVPRQAAVKLQVSRPPVRVVARAEPPPPEPVAPIVVPPVTGPTDPRIPVPAKRDQSGNQSLTRILGLKLNRVVLDAGHGGHDTGTISPRGLAEKELVLDVTLRLGQLLEQRLGTQVIYTRKDDRFIPLDGRPQIANENKADLFLSIHANSSAVRSVAGVETFYLSFTSSKVDLDVAARENASSEKSMHELGDMLKQIALQDKLDESRDFASRIQRASHELSVQSNGRIYNRGVKKAPFVVLIGTSMPAVLTEIGFITNPREETLMRTPEHRQKIAEALYKGIVGYADGLSKFNVARESGSSSRSAAGTGNSQ
ncbi:MAG: N-acetylmuramoyl-L-alanine amidase [Bryobacteraceae bacterium]